MLLAIIIFVVSGEVTEIVPVAPIVKLLEPKVMVPAVSVVVPPTFKSFPKVIPPVKVLLTVRLFKAVVVPAVV